MEKTYNPQDIEQPLYEHWEKQGYFKPNGDESQESFCIMIPPPNVTGSLHMGHAFQQTIMDTMIRYQRMQGKNTLWQVGTDHAGIATQMVVERKIAAEEGKTRHDYGREAFIDKIWEWKAESGGTITRQMRRLGNSVDWDRERFTMDEGLSNAVKEVFVRLYKEDLIYRGKRLVNWDPKLRTAISDLEVENRESKGSMWHIRYPLADGAKTADGKDYLVVATTRPETLLGDTGVAVNPEDPRYKDLIGKYVILPLVNRRIPIVGDEHADMEKGTGCVKITPAHDFNDYEVGKRHALPMINILTFDGDIRESAQVFDTKGNESDVYSSEIPAEFQKPEMIVVSECYWTAAAKHADIVLPITTSFERNDLTMTGDYSNQHIVPMKQAVPPQFEARNDTVSLSEGTTWAKAPWRFEAGTPNTGGIIGLGAALEYVSALGLNNIAEYERNLMHYALSQLESVPDLTLYGPRNRLGVIAFNLGKHHAYDVGHNYAVHPDQCITTNHTAMQNSTMTDMAVLPHNGVGIAVAVHDATILNIGPRLHDQPPVITAQ